MTDEVRQEDALEKLISDALYEHDPMCGRADCEYTAPYIANAVRTYLESPEAVERAARVIAQGNADAAWRIVGMEANQNAFDEYTSDAKVETLGIARAALNAAGGKQP